MDDFFMSDATREEYELNQQRLFQMKEIENLVNHIHTQMKDNQISLRKKRELQQEINQINRDTVSFLEKGYNKLLVVEKDVQTGARGGQYYYNNEGKKIYLKASGKQKCNESNLKGVYKGCHS